MPIVRKATEEFVEYWNSHKIRKQRDRPNSVSGKPIVLYKYRPGTTRYGCKVDKVLIAELKNDFNDWGRLLAPLFVSTPLFIADRIAANKDKISMNICQQIR
jgi:hypothetical protein